MQNKEKTKIKKKLRRKARTRAKISGTQSVPRLSVYRSLKHIYAQLIDDEKDRTLVAASDQENTHSASSGQARKPLNLARDRQEIKKVGGISIAYQVGRMLAEKAVAKKIKKCVFDKGAYRYHGRVKAVADGAREGGLKF